MNLELPQHGRRSEKLNTGPMINNMKLTWKASARMLGENSMFSLNTEICSQGLHSLGINSSKGVYRFKGLDLIEKVPEEL